MMKLSENTVSLLKNFSTINPNIVVKTGSVIKTMSESKTIMSVATVTENFPNDFGIYDLNEFLSVVNMFDDPDLEFSDDAKSVRFVEGKQSVKYYFSSPEILTSPSKDITMPPCEVSFTLTAENMGSIRKAAGALGMNDVVIRISDGASIVVTDTSDPTSNSYEMELENCSYPDVECELVFNISNFKFINDDYDVSISSKLISNFKAKNNPVEYWVALEKNSKFGG